MSRGQKHAVIRPEWSAGTHLVILHPTSSVDEDDIELMIACYEQTMSVAV